MPAGGSRRRVTKKPEEPTSLVLPIGVADGLSAGGMLMVSVTTPSSIPTNEDYVLPGCLGNWGYEVAGWAGSVAIMPSSVAVPQSFVPKSVPEPSGLLALASCLGSRAGAETPKKITNAEVAPRTDSG